MARISLTRVASENCFPRGRVAFQLCSTCKTPEDVAKIDFFVKNMCEQMGIEEHTIIGCIDDETEHTNWFIVDSTDIEELKDAYRDSKVKYKEQMKK